MIERIERKIIKKLLAPENLELPILTSEISKRQDEIKRFCEPCDFLITDEEGYVSCKMLKNGTLQHNIARRGRCVWASYKGSRIIQTIDGLMEHPKQEPYVIPPYS